MPERKPDEGTVRAVLERACRAPSLHNSQPWRWRWDGSTLSPSSPRPRAAVAEPAGPRFPQLLVRSGRSLGPPPPRTPGEVLEVVGDSAAVRSGRDTGGRLPGGP
ncbi:hypothetical protein [Nocardia testacea]|uniref:hypothetical protein n=1 Tax=Nocardia testacea TaxID=248551 RepID=UPI003A8C445B